jgi:hypothetical protein
VKRGMEKVIDLRFRVCVMCVFANVGTGARHGT